MRELKYLGVVLACLLSMHAESATAQYQGMPVDYRPPVSISEASFSDIANRLNALEIAVEESSKQTQESLDDSCREVAVLDKTTLKVFGRVHADYWGFPKDSPLPNYLETGDANTAPEDFIGFRRLRIGVRGDVYETMTYKIAMDFATPQDAAFKDAYLGWKEMPILQTVLLGNQKRPYGLETLNSSRYNVFMERPFTVEAFNQDARRIGIQSYGLSDNERWNWRYGYFIMDDLQKAGGQYADNYQSEVAGRLANTIWYDEMSDGRGYAHWAISGSAAFPGGGSDARFLTRPEARTQEKWFDTGVVPGGNAYQLLGLEGVLNLGPLSIVGEYQTTQMQRSAGSDLRFGGGYVYAAYWLTGESTPWDRKSGTLGRTKPFENFFLVRNFDGSRGRGWGAWQIGGRYSHGDFSDEDIFGGVGDSFTFAANWWWNSHSRMQFNYINGQITDRVAAGAPATSGTYNMFGTRFMTDF